MGIIGSLPVHGLLSGHYISDNAHYVNLQGDPTGSRAFLNPGRCGRNP